jgi:hypothetical protein
MTGVSAQISLVGTRLGVLTRSAASRERLARKLRQGRGVEVPIIR